jgi:predicted transcriptional regulator
MSGLPEGLGPLEERVMQRIRSRGSATARELWEELAEGRAYTTVMTTVDRLHRKGLLERDKEGLAWRYFPRQLPQEQNRSRADALAQQLLDEGEGLGLVALVEAADAAVLERLSALIQARRAR